MIDPTAAGRLVMWSRRASLVASDRIGCQNISHDCALDVDHAPRPHHAACLGCPDKIPPDNMPREKQRL